MAINRLSIKSKNRRKKHRLEQTSFFLAGFRIIIQFFYMLNTNTYFGKCRFPDKFSFDYKYKYSYKSFEYIFKKMSQKIKNEYVIKILRIVDAKWWKYITCNFLWHRSYQINRNKFVEKVDGYIPINSHSYKG